MIKDLELAAALGLIKNRETPVIEDPELHPADGFEQAAIAAVAAGERERLKQARHAMVLDRAIVAASLWPRAQQSSSCPSPVAPVTSRFSCVDPVAADEVWRRRRGRCRAACANQRLPRMRPGAARRTEAGRETFGVARRLRDRRGARCALRTAGR